MEILKRIKLSHLILFGVFAVMAVWVQKPYWTGERLFYHDSILAMTNMHLFYEAIFSGSLPLWDPYSNGGQPLWPLVELTASYDPVAFLCWGGRPADP